MTIPQDKWVDVIFALPDGREICVSIYKDETFRLMERVNPSSSWGAPVEGVVFK